MNSTAPGMAPRTGALATRQHKMAPLLTPAHQRMINLNTSQAFPPAPEPVTQYDVDREKAKIARFINTKERSGQVLADREGRIEARLREMEKR